MIQLNNLKVKILNKSESTPFVWQLSVLELVDKTLISGVVVFSLPFAHDRKTGYFKNFIRSISSYFIKAYAVKVISIKFNGRSITTQTNSRGSFRVVIDEEVVNESVKINTSSGKDIEIVQAYPIVFKKASGKIDVISDVDDTIVVSYTKNVLKRIGSILFTPPRKRKPIGFTQSLFNCFEKKKARVHYISKSESNLFAMLTSIIQHNQLPLGNLILTPYLKFAQLFNSKKGRDYKLNHITFILNHTQDKKYILIGDDSQKDMEVYATIVERFPERVLKVYIRQTKSRVKTYQKMMLDNLKATGIDYVYFNDDTALDAEAEYETLLNKIL